MNDKFGQSLGGVRRRCALVILTAVLLPCWNGLALAGGHYLAPGHPDGLVLLPPPPEAGSAEAAADLATVRAAFKARTPAETARAKQEEGLSFTLFAPAIGPAFQLDHLPKTAALLKEVRDEIGGIIDEPKDHFKRLRPFQVDGELLFGTPERGFSYPSGHSARGTVYALVLAEIFPEKQEAILAEGREIGWDRVLVGKHFPTDIQAGRVLGQAIVHELEASPAFEHDLAEARAEAQAAQHELK
jgi:acid phosphatase (class A)